MDGTVSGSMDGAIAKVNVAMMGSWSEFAESVVKDENIDANTQF